jgi:hypothetical protein
MICRGVPGATGESNLIQGNGYRAVMKKEKKDPLAHTRFIIEYEAYISEYVSEGATGECEILHRKLNVVVICNGKTVGGNVYHIIYDKRPRHPEVKVRELETLITNFVNNHLEKAISSAASSLMSHATAKHDISGKPLPKKKVDVLHKIRLWGADVEFRKHFDIPMPKKLPNLRGRGAEKKNLIAIGAKSLREQYAVLRDEYKHVMRHHDSLYKQFCSLQHNHSRERWQNYWREHGVPMFESLPDKVRQFFQRR